MKRLITSSSNKVDLSRIYSIGLEIIDELRELYPDIPAKPKYRRKLARPSKNLWKITFDLGISITKEAREYRDSIDPDDAQLYWDYIHEFQDTCKEITDKYTDDTAQCTVYYTDFGSGGRTKTKPRPGSDRATLIIYDMLLAD